MTQHTDFKTALIAEMVTLGAWPNLNRDLRDASIAAKTASNTHADIKWEVFDTRIELTFGTAPQQFRESITIADYQLAALEQRGKELPVPAIPPAPCAPSDLPEPPPMIVPSAVAPPVPPAVAPPVPPAVATKSKVNQVMKCITDWRDVTVTHVMDSVSWIRDMSFKHIRKDGIMLSSITVKDGDNNDFVITHDDWVAFDRAERMVRLTARTVTQNNLCRVDILELITALESKAQKMGDE